MILKITLFLSKITYIVKNVILPVKPVMVHRNFNALNVNFQCIFMQINLAKHALNKAILLKINYIV